MADLRITGVSNNQLELEAPDGTRHHLEISVDLTKALKSRNSALPQTISAREIQHAVREGSSIEEIVASSGADEDLVRKFALPILAELNHIVKLARNVRLSLAGDRFTEQTQVEFGSVMDERLITNKAKNSKWYAIKSPEGDWLVSVSYIVSGSAGVATWSFDPKQLFLVPENESALQLSNGLPLSAMDAAHPSTSLDTQLTESVIEVFSVEDEVTPTGGLSIVPELIEIDEEEVSAVTPTEVIDIATRGSFRLIPDDTALPHSRYLDEQLSPIPEADQALETHQSSDIFEEVVVEEEFVGNQSEETIFEEKTDSPPVEETQKPQSTSRWAEVLFGSRDDEEEESKNQ